VRAPRARDDGVCRRCAFPRSIPVSLPALQHTVQQRHGQTGGHRAFSSIRHALACFQRYRDLNAVEPTEAGLELSLQIRVLLRAAHHVLSGGRVAVRAAPGRADVVQELDTRAQDAVAQANAISRENGVYMTVQR
jgi:hypothetical protein